MLAESLGVFLLEKGRIMDPGGPWTRNYLHHRRFRITYPQLKVEIEDVAAHIDNIMTFATLLNNESA
jgi:hypothetical protein